MRILPLIAALLISTCLAVGASAKTAPQSDPQDDIISAGLGDYLSARFAANQRDYGEAARLFRASLERDPANPELLAAAFYFAVSSGDLDQGAKLAQRVVVNSPDDRIARMTLAIAALKARDYHKARSELSRSAKGPLTSFAVTLMDGWAAAGAGDAGAARANFASLHALRSADGMVYFNEALLAEYFGEKDAANTAYKAARDSSGPTLRLTEAYGRFLERSGRAGEARALYEKVAAENGFGAVATPGLARLAAGTVPDALAPRAEDGAAEALFGIAATLNDEANRDVSILYLRLALYLNPKLDLGVVVLGERLEAIGKLEEANAAYATIGEKSPYYRVAVIATAENLAQLDKLRDAEKLLQTLAGKFPEEPEVLTALANCYRADKRYSEAVTAYDKVLKVLGPVTKKTWPLLYARATAEQEMGNWEKAEADLKQALTVSPNEPQLLNHLGYSWIEQKRNIKEALTMLEKARALSPQDGYIIDSVGWAYYAVGRYEDAVNALEDAVQIVPGDPTINDHLGDAYWKVGRKLDATFQWHHALAFGAEAGDKAKIEKKLQTNQP